MPAAFASDDAGYGGLALKEENPEDDGWKVFAQRQAVCPRTPNRKDDGESWLGVGGENYSGW